MRNRYTWIACSIGLSILPLEARVSPYGVDQTANYRDSRDAFDEVRHRVNNHEVEIKRLTDKLNHYDVIVDSFKQQAIDQTQNNKALIQEKSNQLDMKVGSLETLNKSLVADLKVFKQHASESATELSAAKERITDLEKELERQAETIEQLHAALKSVIEAMQGSSKPSITSHSSKTYKVKSGDSLEKIAKSHQVSIQQLKEYNQLTNDKIIVGQTLQIP